MFLSQYGIHQGAPTLFAACCRACAVFLNNSTIPRGLLTSAVNQPVTDGLLTLNVPRPLQMLWSIPHTLETRVEPSIWRLLVANMYTVLALLSSRAVSLSFPPLAQIYILWSYSSPWQAWRSPDCICFNCNYIRWAMRSYPAHSGFLLSKYLHPMFLR